MKKDLPARGFQQIRTLYRATGRTAVILPTAILVDTGSWILGLAMVFYMRDVHGAAPGLVGWLMATWQACYICGCLTTRPMYSRILPRYIIIAAVAGLTASVVGIFSFPIVVLTFVFYGLFGVSLSLFWPPLMGWLSYGLEGRDLSRAIFRFALCVGLGVTFSPLIAGLLSTLDPIYPLYVTVCLFATAWLLLTVASLALPQIRNDSHRDQVKSGSQRGEDRSTLLRYPAWVGLFASYVVFGIIVTVFPMYGRTSLAISKSTIGILLLFRPLFGVLGYILLGRFHFWHFKSLPMIIGLGLLAGLMAGLAWIRLIPVLGVIVALVGFLLAASFTYSFFHGTSGSSNRSTRMAIHEALLAGGMIVGSSVGGQLFQRFSMVAVCVFGISVLLTGLVAQIFLSLWAKNREQPRA
jgi:DHA1 family multidrug resistance protein-like MFS transporter/DHA1 family quinolone resistance protein-like MFS transporter